MLTVEETKETIYKMFTDSIKEVAEEHGVSEKQVKEAYENSINRLYYEDPH